MPLRLSAKHCAITPANVAGPVAPAITIGVYTSGIPRSTASISLLSDGPECASGLVGSL